MNLIDRLAHTVAAEIHRGSLGRLVWIRVHASVSSDAPHLPLLRSLLQVVLGWFNRPPRSFVKIGDLASRTMVVIQFEHGEGALVALATASDEKSARFLVEVLGDRGAVSFRLPEGEEDWQLEPLPEEQTQEASRLLQQAN